ncbi:hypothetical protein E5288_WYG005033 [Bos mutus]|uniref:Uncharacterized protein n=1 Tax=Bos mutus TaxID=72004 RepID=A0A6B0R3F7_9CETA|nr:hypothetical protein [Bos mutus]
MLLLRFVTSNHAVEWNMVCRHPRDMSHVLLQPKPWPLPRMCDGLQPELLNSCRILRESDYGKNDNVIQVDHLELHEAAAVKQLTAMESVMIPQQAREPGSPNPARQMQNGLAEAALTGAVVNKTLMSRAFMRVLMIGKSVLRMWSPYVTALLSILSSVYGVRKRSDLRVGNLEFGLNSTS